MAGSFRLQITTPEREFFHGNVETLVIRSTDGELGILPGHLPMVVALVTAPAKIKVSGEWKWAAVSGGFALIREGSVVLLADTAEWPEEIEENRALEAKRRAEKRMRERDNELEFLRSRVALERALTRLQVKNNRL